MERFVLIVSIASLLVTLGCSLAWKSFAGSAHDLSLARVRANSEDLRRQNAWIALEEYGGFVFSRLLHACLVACLLSAAWATWSIR